VNRDTFKDHFSSRAEGYAAFRPTYPAALFAWLASLASGRDLAWDAGTGNGQAAVGLAAHFARVMATDASERQIARAMAHDHVTYRVGRESASGLADGACDLVTAAQALHWFDVAAFFAEARRVLKPGGAIAVWTYAQPSLDDPAADALLQGYVRLMDPYWPPERAMVETGYRTLPFPFAEVAVPAMDLEMHALRHEVVGYLRTWSAHQRYLTEHADDPVEPVAGALAAVWPEGERRRLHWPLFVRAGRLTAGR
jgi:SAM-dependent methyltransferase